MKHIETGKYRSDAKRQWKTMVDDEDFENLNRFHWHVSKFGDVASWLGNHNKRVLMHRYIMNPPEGIEVDHIDGNRLNNQKSNLRFATSSQNKMNRGARNDNKSGFKGVSWHKQRQKWTARIMAGNRYLYLGLFSEIKDAAIAYNVAAKKYHKDFAFINPV